MLLTRADEVYQIGITRMETLQLQRPKIRFVAIVAVFREILMREWDSKFTHSSVIARDKIQLKPLYQLRAQHRDITTNFIRDSVPRIFLEIAILCSILPG